MEILLAGLVNWFFQCYVGYYSGLDIRLGLRSGSIWLNLA